MGKNWKKNAIYPSTVQHISTLLFSFLLTDTLVRNVSAKFSSVSLQGKTTRDDKLNENSMQVIEAIARPATIMQNLQGCNGFVYVHTVNYNCPASWISDYTLEK